MILTGVMGGRKGEIAAEFVPRGTCQFVQMVEQPGAPSEPILASDFLNFLGSFSSLGSLGLLG